MKNSDQSYRFISDLIRAMQNRSMDYSGSPTDIDDVSPMKEMYGDTWVYLYGVYNGMNKMRSGELVEYDFEKDELVNHGISDDNWQEHYNTFGYGPYGDGLVLGKRLTFYDEETDFTFVEPDDDESDEPKFTFIE